MKDRFKFRAWDKINDEWVKIPHLSLDVETGMLNGFFDYTEAAKRRYTLEQSTGLKDKNGKFIYEGDIVIKDKQQFEVYYDDSLFGYYLRSNNIITVFASNTELEVIGNIHENADLLGEDK